MTDPSPGAPSLETTRPRPASVRPLVFLVACAAFGVGLGAEPPFVDESAYLSQAFYADLLLEGRRDDPAWLEYGGYDLPPLPKYLIGSALRLGGFARPGRAAPAIWYANTSKRFVSAEALTVARMPSVLLGALGCVAIYAIGTRAFGRGAGMVAAGLLMISPLYRLHARRAMSDVPAEACLLVALAFGLAAWSRWVAGKGDRSSWAEMTLGAGTFAGLAVLAKLNGAIAGMVLAAWMVLGVALLRGRLRPSLALVASTIGAGAVAFACFVALNPFLTAHPIGSLRPELEQVARASFGRRLMAIRDHRVSVSEHGQARFPDDALRTPIDKLEAVAVQGYGRFSPLGPAHSDSTRRFDWRQDWGAVVWIPLVLAGSAVALGRGRAQHRSHEPPTAWAVVVAAIVAFVAVASFIPLAWDRYYLSLQPGAILLASAAIAAPFARLRRPEPAP